MTDDWPVKLRASRASMPRQSAPPGSGGVAIEFSDPRRLLPPDALERLGGWGSLAAARLAARGEVRVRLVDDTEMAAAHERYSGIPGTTDVLTFDLTDRGPADGESGGAVLDVDILACVDEARRQAERRGHGVERELLLYTVHGLLHCLGEDDHDDAAYARMHAREDELLEAIGAGRVFAAPEREAGGVR